jgi:hypothetical protein
MDNNYPYISGITLVATNDNILFPFTTEFLINHPITLIVFNITGFTMYNGMKVIKVGLSSIDIQAYMVLTTGFTLSPLCYYKEEDNTDNDECESQCSVNTRDITYKGDGLDILEDDEHFADFDSFVSSR